MVCLYLFAFIAELCGSLRAYATSSRLVLAVAGQARTQQLIETLSSLGPEDFHGAVEALRRMRQRALENSSPLFDVRRPCLTPRSRYIPRPHP
jgi:hypothetical protein